MQRRESWIREISIENLLRCLRVERQIYVLCLAERFFLAARGDFSLNLAVLDFEPHALPTTKWTCGKSHRGICRALQSLLLVGQKRVGG